MPLKQTTGSRAMVMHGTAKKTSGGLTKSQLKYNKQGKIVSKKASALAKKNNRLVKAGYVTKKGQFGVSMRGGEMTENEITENEITENEIQTYVESLRESDRFNLFALYGKYNQVDRKNILTIFKENHKNFYKTDQKLFELYPIPRPSNNNNE